LHKRAARPERCFSVQANADQAYTGVLDLADHIDREQLGHHIGLFRRGEYEPRYRPL
jgi:hypothetical protein